jgi:uncharacterized membrane protein
MPNPHPFLTHFPIALLVVGFFCDLAARRWTGGECSRYGWWNQLLGTAGLAGTIVTGLLAEARTVIPLEARPSFEAHEQFAFAAAAIFALLLFWRIASRTSVPAKNAWVFLLLYGAGIIVLCAGALYGGEIVYQFGIGVSGLRGPR